MLFIATYFFVDYRKILTEMLQMFLGRIPPPEHFTLASATLDISALVVINIVVVIAVMVIPAKAGMKMSIFVDFSSLPIRGINMVVLLEEILARGLLFWLPLVLSGYNIYVFYTFWILSNAVWGGLHLWNYRKEDRSIKCAVPAFVSGILVFTYAFFKFGFWASYATHLFYDFILISMFAGKRELRVSFWGNLPARLAAIALGTLLLGMRGLGFSNFVQSITTVDYFQWFFGNFASSNISMLSFVGFMLLVGSFLGLAFDIAGFDESTYSSSSTKLDSLGFLPKRVAVIIISMIFGIFRPVVLYAFYLISAWIVATVVALGTNAGIVSSTADYKTAPMLLIAFLLSFVQGGKNSSMSQQIRNFILSFPNIFLMLMYMTLTPWWDFFTTIFVLAVISGLIATLRAKP